MEEERVYECNMYRSHVNRFGPIIKGLTLSTDFDGMIQNVFRCILIES